MGKIKYTNTFIKKIALKYLYRSDFEKYDKKVYRSARARWLLNKVCSHMLKKGNLVNRLVYEFTFIDNSKYIGITYDFSKRYAEHCSGILKNNKIKHILITKFMSLELALKLEEDLINYYLSKEVELHNKGIKRNSGNILIKWTLPACKKEAIKYSSRFEWQKNQKSSYMAAQKRGWLEVCCVHMKKTERIKEVLNLDTGEVYESTTKAIADIKRSYNTLQKAILANTKCVNCKWTYINPPRRYQPEHRL